MFRRPTAIWRTEVLAQRRMIERTQDRFGFWPEKLGADTAPNLAWLVEERGIAPHIPVFEKYARHNGTFERSAFSYDDQDHSFVCLGGNRLRTPNGAKDEFHLAARAHSPR